jgi:hypothetical protein
MAIGSAEFRHAVDGESWDGACRALSNSVLLDDLEAFTLVSAEAQTTLCASGSQPRSGIAQAFAVEVPVSGSDGLNMAALVAYPGPRALEQLVGPSGWDADERLFLIDARAELLFAPGNANAKWP